MRLNQERKNQKNCFKLCSFCIIGITAVSFINSWLIFATLTSPGKAPSIHVPLLLLPEDAIFYLALDLILSVNLTIGVDFIF